MFAGFVGRIIIPRSSTGEIGFSNFVSESSRDDRSWKRNVNLDSQISMNKQYWIWFSKVGHTPLVYICSSEIVKVDQVLQ